MRPYERKETPLQVLTLSSYLIRKAPEASRLIDAHFLDPGAARRRDAVRRWREAMARGLSAGATAVPRATLYRWEKRCQFRSRRSHQRRAPRRNPDTPTRQSLNP